MFVHSVDGRQRCDHGGMTLHTLSDVAVSASALPGAADTEGIRVWRRSWTMLVYAAAGGGTRVWGREANAHELPRMQGLQC